MGRNVKQGFSYFSLDVDIFSDIKIRKLIKNHSGRALSVYICVLAFIYRNGYYVLNDEDFGFIVSEQTGDKVEFIEAVLDYCVKVGLFSAEMFEQGVYTSKGVQERYLAMCKASRRNIVFSEYTLISSEEIGINSEEIAINSEKTPIKKSKVNNISFLEKKKQKSASVKKSGIEEIDFQELSVETLKEEKEKNYLISQEEFKNNNYWYWNMSKSAISQYQFIKEIFSKGYIRSGRSIGGGVYTQYDILKDKVFPDTKGEDLSENKRKYSVFWRIDTKNKIGVYISLNFYTEHNKGDVKPRCREDEYNKLKEFLGIKPLLEDLIKKYFLIDTNTEIPYN